MGYRDFQPECYIFHHDEISYLKILSSLQKILQLSYKLVCVQIVQIQEVNLLFSDVPLFVWGLKFKKHKFWLFSTILVQNSSFSLFSPIKRENPKNIKYIISTLYFNSEQASHGTMNQHHSTENREILEKKIGKKIVGKIFFFEF